MDNKSVVDENIEIQFKHEFYQCGQQLNGVAYINILKEVSMNKPKLLML